jgi:hypothetical protein
MGKYCKKGLFNKELTSFEFVSKKGRIIDLP